MDATNSRTTHVAPPEGRGSTGGSNSSPEFYQIGTARFPIPTAGDFKNFMMEHSLPGLAIRKGMEYAKSDDFKSKVEYGQEKLEAATSRARGLIDDLRGAVPQGVKDAVEKGVERISPAITALKRGASELLNQNEPAQYYPSGRGRRPRKPGEEGYGG